MREKKQECVSIIFDMIKVAGVLQSDFIVCFMILVPKVVAGLLEANTMFRGLGSYQNDSPMATIGIFHFSDEISIAILIGQRIVHPEFGRDSV